MRIAQSAYSTTGGGGNRPLLVVLTNLVHEGKDIISL